MSDRTNQIDNSTATKSATSRNDWLRTLREFRWTSENVVDEDIYRSISRAWWTCRFLRFCEPHFGHKDLLAPLQFEVVSYYCGRHDHTVMEREDVFTEMIVSLTNRANPMATPILLRLSFCGFDTGGKEDGRDLWCERIAPSTDGSYHHRGDHDWPILPREKILVFICSRRDDGKCHYPYDSVPFGMDKCTKISGSHFSQIRRHLGIPAAIKNSDLFKALLLGFHPDIHEFVMDYGMSLIIRTWSHSSETKHVDLCVSRNATNLTVLELRIGPTISPILSLIILSIFQIHPNRINISTPHISRHNLM
jgi:hypothetical protein